MKRSRWLLPLTLLVMLTGTLPVFSLAVLAPFLTGELAIGPGRFGVISSALFLSATLVAPRAGRLVDTVGARRGVVAVAALSGVAHIAIGVATGTVALLVAGAAGGVAVALTNPVTNQLIVSGTPSRGRGLLLGIKQSGVPLAAVVAGAILPSIAAVGWRLAALAPLALGVVTASAAGLVQGTSAADRPAGRAFRSTRPLRLLRWYTALMGGASGLVNTFLVLFAVDAIGVTPTAAGMAAAVMGGVAVGARIGWTHLSERTGRTVGILGTTAGLGLLTGMWLLAAEGIGPPAVWVASVVAGLGVIAWHGVGMLAVLERSTSDTVGAASGYVVRGFYLGLLVTPAAFGALVDLTGSYRLLWIAQALLCLGATIPMLALRRSQRSEQEAAA